MCGILGCVGVNDAADVLYEGLGRLEYRGYDSAGIAVGDGEDLHVTKVPGRVDGLDQEGLPPTTYGIAHTRWATHGPPTPENAHPHLSCEGRVAVVHNGIIENHASLRDALEAEGHSFTSDTDTEVVAHLIEHEYEGDIVAALEAASDRLDGSYALLATHASEPDVIAATRHRSPLVLGLGEDERFVASDVVAFRAHTDKVVFLEDGDLARLTPDGYEVEPATPRSLEPSRVDWKLEEATKAGFPHYMLKEIHEQPRAMSEALMNRTDPGSFPIEGGALTLDRLASFDEVIFLACGSSFNAAMAAKPLFEKRAGMATRVELASEFDPVEALRDRAFVVTVTQSGETADTLGALRSANDAGFTTLSITNVMGSTATREADGWIPIRAGPEISVAATKSFTSQLIVLHALALQLSYVRSTTQRSRIVRDMEALSQVPNVTRRLLDETDRLEEVGRWLADHDRCFVLGRGQGQAVALETALKIKEISYIHAEGLAAGELKHGPLALVEEGTPVLSIAPGDEDLERMVSSMQEVAARGGHVLPITDASSTLEEAGFNALEAPSEGGSTPAYAATLAGQLIAYHAAVARGTNVDKPRNLAKSVTVE